jgi:hypothetical protein
MRQLLNVTRAVGCVLIMASAAAADTVVAQTLDPVPTGEMVRWRPDSLGMNVLSTILFGAVGIVLAIVGFKLFDLVTPGRLQEEICEKQNLAAGILGAAVILGISIIIAAAVY